MLHLQIQVVIHLGGHIRKQGFRRKLWRNRRMTAHWQVSGRNLPPFGYYAPHAADQRNSTNVLRGFEVVSHRAMKNRSTRSPMMTTFPRPGKTPASEVVMLVEKNEESIE